MRQSRPARKSWEQGRAGGGGEKVQEGVKELERGGGKRE